MVALIGGSGFIGTRLAGIMDQSGIAFRIIDLVASPLKTAQWVQGDVRDQKALRKAMEGCDSIVNLAAQHRDDVRPITLYTEVNVNGAGNVCAAAEDLGIQRIIFTSSVAVYGSTMTETDETGVLNPNNEYGRTKREAEQVYLHWQSCLPERSLSIVRPTVVFGEGNRGNVFNLLRMIASDKFLMVGRDKTVKSISYVENVSAFLFHLLDSGPGVRIFNYADKPDMSTEELVLLVKKVLGKRQVIGLRIPYWIGYAGGSLLDIIAALTGRRLPISAIRIRKFCMNSQFTSNWIEESGFIPPVRMVDALVRTIQHELTGAQSIIKGGSDLGE